MQARHDAAQVCPLCREAVGPDEGRACETCGAVVHAACERELGGCHGGRPPRPRPRPRRNAPARDLRPWAPPTRRTPAEVRARLAEFRGAPLPRASGPVGPASWGEAQWLSMLGFAAGCGLVGWVQHGLHGVMAALPALFFAATLQHLSDAWRTGKFEGEEGGPEITAWADPGRFALQLVMLVAFLGVLGLALFRALASGPS